MNYGTVITQKLANAFFAHAEADLSAVPGPGTLKQIIGSELNRVKEKQKGLWVGGTATLTDTHFLFSSNALNNAVHTEKQAFAIPLADIASVAVKFGWLTKIIAITTRSGETFRVRCFGAKDLAEQIRQRV